MDVSVSPNDVSIALIDHSYGWIVRFLRFFSALFFSIDKLQRSLNFVTRCYFILPRKLLKFSGIERLENIRVPGYEFARMLVIQSRPLFCV